jgi:ketosteroid isomerase-like protein
VPQAWFRKRRDTVVSPHDIHRELLTAWNNRDFERYRSLLHPEYTYTAGDGAEMKGGPDVGVGVGRMFANAFPDSKVEIKGVYVQGDTAIAEFVARGTHDGELMGIGPTGKHVEINVCNIIEVRDGKAYREREYLDMLALLSQLGVIKAPAAAAPGAQS